MEYFAMIVDVKRDQIFCKALKLISAIKFIKVIKSKVDIYLNGIFCYKS